MAPYPVVNGFTYLTPHVIQIMELSRYYLVVVLVFHSQSSQTQEKEVKSVLYAAWFAKLHQYRIDRSGCVRHVDTNTAPVYLTNSRHKKLTATPKIQQALLYLFLLHHHYHV